jgi:hypothetical protein
MLLNFSRGFALQVRHKPNAQTFTGLSTAIPQPLGRRIIAERLEFKFCLKMHFLF